MSCWTSGGYTPPTPPPPPPPQPPVISGIQASGVSEQSVTISWNTDKATTDYIDYGSTTVYGKRQYLTAAGTSHQVALSDFFEPRVSVYHFRITAKDSGGLEAVSADQSFQVVAAVQAATGSSTASETAPEAVNKPVLTATEVLANLASSTTARLLTHEEKVALGFPIYLSIEVKKITVRGVTRTVYNYTSVKQVDTDFDGLPDDLEEDLGTDPESDDTDLDAKTDGYEHYISKTDPTEAD